MKYAFLLLFLSGTLAGQKKIKWDTTQYQKFRSTLIIGIFQSYRNFNNEFKTVGTADTAKRANNYMAESNLVTGLEVNYDKFNFAFALKSTPQKNNTGKGNTKTFNVNLNIGGNIWLGENSLRSFRGFYDANTPSYDSTFKETGNYYYQPNFTNFLFRSKFLFFTNHKNYSFRSNYVCNYRQLKSSGTWIFSVNTNYNYMHNDSSFFPAGSRPDYLDYANMRGLRVFGLAVNAGGAFTVVWWRAFFFHMMFIVGPEHQWRNYEYMNKPTKSLSCISVAGDIRASFGLNFKRAYVLWTSTNDFVFYNTSVLGLQNKSIGGSFTFGWRFKTKTPEFYKKIQATKLYQSL